MRLDEWLRSEPFSLAMSSGFFGFFAHCGMLSVLEKEHLVPQRISGSSAGALIGGLYASGLRTEEIRRVLFELRRRDFWDPGLGLGFLRGKKFLELLRSYLPVQRVQDCPITLSVSVYDLISHRVRVIREGDLGSAIVASCSVPFLFQPVWLGGRPHWDGGVLDRPGVLGVPKGERLLYHHLKQRSMRSRFTGRSVPTFENRPQVQTLMLGSLPKVGPFRLSRGERAYEVARERTGLALQRSIS